MANRKITVVKLLRDAIPEKGLWFDYYGDIFVSVISNSYTSHLRRKVCVPDNKVDNKMSAWHLRWQYEIMENTYGMPVSGKKTYEIPFKLKDELHIIDTVVEKVAIEFQHTLSVSIEEMDSRFIAHRKLGFISYLVLDFSEFSFHDYQARDIKLNQKLNKWIKCYYFSSDCLFIDLQDCLIRFSDNLYLKYAVYQKQFFIESLLQLEIFHKQAVQAFLVSVEERRLKEDEEERLSNQERDEELRLKNRQDKLYSKVYENFRKCFRDVEIRPYVLPFAKDSFSYSCGSHMAQNGLYEKCHTFYSIDNDFRIHYSNYFTVSPDVRVYYGRSYLGSKYEYRYTEITIVDDTLEEKTLIFERRNSITKRIS